MIMPKQELYYILGYRELDELIQRHFNKPDFECIAAYEWSNDSDHTGTVRIAEIEHGFEREEIASFINSPFVPDYPLHWSFLLAELARRGEVPEGNYLIEVCW